MNTNTNHIMLDLETMGTGPNAAIVAIGAVRFNIAAGITDSLYCAIDLESCMDEGQTVTASTIKWWMQQSDTARKEIYSKTNINIDLALMRFTEFVDADKSNAFIWGNGSDFDNAILANAYRLMNIPAPWKFYNNRCYRTTKNLYPQIKIERSGTHHNALDDAVSQTQHLLAILDHANIEI